MFRWSLLAIAYASMAAVAFAVCEFGLGRSVWLHPDPWLGLQGIPAHAYSLVFGVAVGALCVMLTRRLVEKVAWAQELARVLRPFARGMSGTGILVVAALSSVGEELLFRGLLQPWLGVIGQAIVFGVVHQMPGPSRWAWMLWATVIGVLFGVIFVSTGSLVGPLVAHALINGLNLNFLQSYDPEPSRRSLGGLFGTTARP
jgi:membrane protease YdiL (CAAX protease family)